MKKMIFMAFLAMSFTCQAQMNQKTFDLMVTTINKQVGSVAVTSNMLDPLLSKDADKRRRFEESFTNVTEISGPTDMSFVKSDGTIGYKGTEDKLLVRTLNVRKLTGKSEYNGVMAYMYVVEPGKDASPMYIVTGHTESYGEMAASNESNDEMLANTKAPEFGDIVTDNDGTQYVVVRGPDGKQVYKRLAVQENTNGQSSQGSTNGTRNATVTKSISETGDPALISKMEGYGSQQGQGVQASTQPNVPQVMYYQDGGKSIPYYVYNGQIYRLDDPKGPKTITIGGDDVVYALNSEGVWEPTYSTDVNAYKHGVGDFSGYRNNYYRHARNGDPLGHGNTVVVGGATGYPVYGTGGVIIGGGYTFGGGGYCNGNYGPVSNGCSTTYVTGNGPAGFQQWQASQQYGHCR